MAVSIVMPVLNESQHIAAVLTALFNQDYNGQIQLLVVDGCSTDATAQIVCERAAHAPPHVSVFLLTNTKSTIPSSLNIGIAAAGFEIILRLDGHTLPPVDYISKCVQALNTLGLKSIVGGVCHVCPGAKTTIAKAIALGVAHRFGIGNAHYRTGLKGKALPVQVDTVPFGAFHREVWRLLGGYDESLLTAEDYDFNYRARKLGLAVWLLPDVVLLYSARPTLEALAKQYFRYGYWSGALSIKHRCIPAWRKSIPALFCLGLVTALALYPLAFWSALAVYGLISGLIATNKAFLEGSPFIGFALLLVFPVLHFCYGAGSLLSLHKLQYKERITSA